MPTTGFQPPSPGAFGFRAGANWDSAINGPGKLAIFGHSYMDPSQGVNAAGQTPPYINPAESYPRQTMSALDVPEAQVTNYAIPGAVLCQDNSNTNFVGTGGHVQVLQYYSPTNIRQGAAAGLRAPWTSSQGLTVFSYGINDITVYASTSEAGRYRALFYEAWRTVLSRVRSAAVFESLTDTQTTYSGGGLGGANWSQVNATNVNSGTGYARTATVGATATIAVPSDWYGGTIALGFIGRKGAVGGQANITLDGKLVATVNTSNVTADAGATLATALVLTKRISVPVGAHTIVITTTGIDGNFDYNYYQYEATEPNPIIICNINKLRTYPNGYNGDPIVDDWNKVIYDMQTEFGGPIEVADVDDALQQSAAQTNYNNNRISWDNLHLSELGARYAAGAILDAYIRLCQNESNLTTTVTSYRDTMGVGLYQPIIPPTAGSQVVSPGMVGTTATTVVPVANRILFMPFVLPRPCTLTGLYLQGVTAVGGTGQFIAGLYYDKNNNGTIPGGLLYGPGNRLFDWGTLTATVASPKVFTLPAANGVRILSPGIYYLAILPLAGSNFTVNTMSGASPYLLNSSLVGPVNASAYEAQRTATYTTLPSGLAPSDPGFFLGTLGQAPWVTLTLSQSF